MALDASNLPSTKAVLATHNHQAYLHFITIRCFRDILFAFFSWSHCIPYSHSLLMLLLKLVATRLLNLAQLKYSQY